jgi:hypothetical protein
VSAGSSAKSLDVFVAYADSDRPNPASFPSPWYDPSNPLITFEGCHPTSTCEYDAGAVRLVNNSADPIKIDAVKVEYSSACLYDIWPHEVMLASGRELILTQLTSGAGDGCTNTTDPAAPGYGRMDGSDIGRRGASWTANCDQSGVVPQVDVTVNGTPVTFTDEGQVLNTGGKDSGYCPSNPDGTGRNEALPWTRIGSVPCSPAMLTLEPASQDDTRGGIATVTATLQDGCGNPLQGSRVNFRVFGARAPNAGQAGSDITNQHGNASFTYPDTFSALGTDELHASVSGPGGSLWSGIVTVHWVNRPPTGPRGLITHLALRPKAFIPARSGPSVMRAGNARFGTRITYRDSQASITTFTVQRLLPGRHRGRSCVAPSPGNLRGRPCMWRVVIGTFISVDRVGKNRFRFTGRVGRGALAPGNYRLVVVPHTSGGAGRARRVLFQTFSRRKAGRR